MTIKDKTIGWNFDNSYSNLPKSFIYEISPIPVKSPELIILNDNLGKQLGLNFSLISKKELSNLFSGNSLPEGSKSIAQAYAGHQFGHFTMLGDGRAVLMGEHLSKNNERFDIQFKGSGQTPFSRNGDGRAALGPMLREYIISEAMHSLNIPTTRSMAVVKTGEDVVRENILQGAILTRVASSHLRVGTFQYVAMRNNESELRTLVDYTINRHYPNIKKSKNKALDLLKVLIELQIDLVINWMRVGFIHGVMNTDNMSISGETIDYGPCAFMDTYDPQTVFSSIDELGRYAYFNQPSITKWNLARFAECLISLIDTNKEKAIEVATELINSFDKKIKVSADKSISIRSVLLASQAVGTSKISNSRLRVSLRSVFVISDLCDLYPSGISPCSSGEFLISLAIGNAIIKKNIPRPNDVACQPKLEGFTNHAKMGTNMKLPIEKPNPPIPIAKVLFLSNQLFITVIIGSHPPPEAPSITTP